MTTIAVNKKEIACDLQCTYRDNLKLKVETKIIELSPIVSKTLFNTDKVYIGYAGNVDAWADVVMWLTLFEGKPPRSKGLEYLALTNKGKIYHATTMTNWTELLVPQMAIGTGGPYAVAAMEAGKTPLEACKVASKFDPSTGMGFKSYSF